MMGWATGYIEKLLKNETIQCRPRGGSMSGKIESGQLVTVSPDTNGLEVGDIVLCRVKGQEYLHLIKAIDGSRYQIGNNKGGINGWTNKTKIFGRATKVEP